MPFYPVVLAGVIVLAAFLDADVSMRAGIRPFVLVLAAAAILTLITSAILGTPRGPIVSAVLVLVARSGEAFHVAIAILLVVLAFITWRVARRILPASTPADPARLLNGLSLLLLASTLVTSAFTGTLWRFDLQQGRPFAAEPLGADGARPDRPDIYVILLDGYPRADTLGRLFEFDNTPFLAALAQRGFEVADASRSNYLYTAMTLTSMLHMTYVQEIPSAVAGSPEPSLRTLINVNPAWERLRSFGYKIAASQSPWETVGMRDADLFCGDEVNDFEMYLLQMSLVWPVVRLFNPSFEGDHHRDVIRQALDCLARISAPTPSPKLVFTHVGGPHLPIVFTRSGEEAATDVLGENAGNLEVSHERFISAYTEEIEYLNRRVLEAIDLLAQRPNAPIVIVMSDHGSESRLDWADSSQSDLQERFSNFFAARTPSLEDVFPADITPVNLFPLLFNAYFEAGLPVRDPRFFLSPIHNELDFTEIPDPDR